MRFSVYGPPAPPPQDPPPAPYRPTIKVTHIVWILLPQEPKRISAEDYFMVTELVDGTLYAWGDNQFGQYAGELLEPEQGLPEKVWPATAGDALDAGPILDMTTGFGSTFVVTANGLYGTGSNYLSQQMQPYPVLEDFPDEGELLYNHTWKKLPDARRGVDGGAVVEAAGSDPIAKLWKSNGLSGTGCYLTVSGKAYCWGSNEVGQIGSAAVDSGIGSGKVNVAQVPTQVDLPAGRTVTQIRVGSRACAITDDGAVYCWGDNTNGYFAQFPAGGVYLTPQLVPGVSDAKVIAVGGRYFACALSGNHKTYCWGDNGYGQRGIDPADGGGSQFGNTVTEVPLTW